MNILQIDTATSVCSVALSHAGETIAASELDEPNVHASKLTRLIEEVVKKASLQLSDLNAVAVSKGPGSYTGLRIGVSTAKGLCYGLDIPLIAIDSLHALANGYIAGHSMLDKDGLLCPMIDARRLEVYTALYSTSGQQKEPTAAKILDSSYFDGAPSSQQFILFGDGADKFEDLFSNKANVQVIQGFRQSASFLSSLAFEAYRASQFEDVAYFEPYYLKDFVPLAAKKK